MFFYTRQQESSLTVKICEKDLGIKITKKRTDDTKITIGKKKKNTKKSLKKHYDLLQKEE